MPMLSLGQVMSAGTTMAGGRNDFQPSEASFYANLALEQVVEAAGVNHITREALAISSTTSGGNRIALPSDFNAPLAMTLFVGSSSTNTTSRVTNTVPLRQMDAAWADTQPNQYGGGTPHFYIWYGTWLELFPSPNSAYSIQLRYQAKQATLVQSTDTPALDARWCQAWLYKTAELLHAARDDREGEIIARGRFMNYVTLLETDTALRQKDRKGMVLRYGGGRMAKGD